jgi:hypothetical protein
MQLSGAGISVRPRPQIRTDASDDAEVVVGVPESDRPAQTGQAGERIADVCFRSRADRQHEEQS